MKIILKSEQAFTFVELLVTMGIISVLASTALSNFSLIKIQARDSTAQSDYRNLKTAVINTSLDPQTPNIFIISRRRGPVRLPYPLDMISISSNVEVRIFHLTLRRLTGSLRTLTNIDVRHLDGSKRYRYIERNGVVTEQVIDLL